MDLQNARERVDSVRRFSEVSNSVETKLVDEALSGAESEVSSIKAQLDRASEEFIKRPHGLFQIPTRGVSQQLENGSTTETLSELTTRFATEFDNIDKDLLRLGAAAEDHIKKIEDIQDFNTKAIEVHEARHQQLQTLQTVVGELEHRQANDETTHDRYVTQMQHMENSIQDLQNGVDELRGEFEELKVPSNADRPTSREVSSIEGRLAHLEDESKCKIDELTRNQATHDIQMKAFSSHLEDTSRAFSSLEEKLNGMEKAFNAGSLEVSGLDQAIANCKNDVSELHTTFKRAREEESSRRQEEREERARLQQSHDALLQKLDKRDAEFHKLCARFTQVSFPTSIRGRDPETPSCSWRPLRKIKLLLWGHWGKSWMMYFENLIQRWSISSNRPKNASKLNFYPILCSSSFAAKRRTFIIGSPHA
jgi:chromosome segregation ATPase